MQNQNRIITRVADTKNFTFNLPDVGDRVILLHNLFDGIDNNTIMVLNQQLQQIGQLTRYGGFNQRIGKVIDWKPFVADVIEIYPQFMEIFISIDASNLKVY